jgi:hypothetical protein
VIAAKIYDENHHVLAHIFIKDPTSNEPTERGFLCWKCGELKSYSMHIVMNHSKGFSDFTPVSGCC